MNTVVYYLQRILENLLSIVKDIYESPFMEVLHVSRIQLHAASIARENSIHVHACMNMCAYHHIVLAIHWVLLGLVEVGGVTTKHRCLLHPRPSRCHGKQNMQ